MQFNQEDIDIGERLRGIRENMHMTREQFSEKIDITDSFLGQIERGERSLSVKTLKKVVKYAGVSADYLLFGNQNNNEVIQKINNILTLNSDITSDFIYHIVMCSNDFCKKILDEKLKKVITAKEKFEEKNAKILKNREAKRKEPYKIRYNKNKNAKWLILIMAICVLTGLLTPLGDTPYTYLYKTMKGNTTKSISEHLPLTLINNKEMLVVLTATLALLIFTDTKIRLKDLFMFAGLTLLMFMTRRQESMLVLLGSAVLATLITQLFMKYDSKGLKEFEDIAVSSLGTIAVVLLIVLLSVIEIKPKLDDKFVNPSTYPVDAAKYIKENLDVNSIKLFNEYNYGSYLLFEGIPVFIDSRADLYAPEFNGVKGKDGKYEGQDIFSDYINTSNISKYYENTFNTYGITHVILYKNSKLNIFLSRSDRYKELYSDKKFVIYERD